MAPARKKTKLDPALHLLSLRGEKFMQMFDDVPKAEPRKAKSTTRASESVETEDDTKPEENSPIETGPIESIVSIPRHKVGAGNVTLPGATGARYKPSKADLSAAKSKRHFLSGKAALVHTDKRPRQSDNKHDNEGNLGGLSEMLREVETFGATGLDKKQQAKIEAERLSRMKARPERNCRIPATHAKTMMKKLAAKEKEELETAIASGMVQQKGMGKKKRRQQDQERRSNLGLYEDGGAFRHGMLDLRKLPGEGKKRRRK